MQTDSSSRTTRRGVICGLTALTFSLLLASIAFAESRPAEPLPEIPYWSQWTDHSGQTHTTRCLLAGLESKAFSSTPQYIRQLPGNVENVIFTQLPVGWVGNWHMNPKRQWVLMLSGEYFMETSDGSHAVLKPGGIFFGGDQGAKGSQAEPNKIGHTSRVVGNAPVNQVIVQLKNEPNHSQTGTACPY